MGTLLPALLVAGFFALAGIGSHFDGEGPPQWFRGSIYAFGLLMTLLGAYACYRIASFSPLRGWSVFLYTLFIREIAFVPICVVLLNTAADLVDTPAWFPFALLVPSFLAIGAANGILYASLKADVLEERVDPVPGRSLIHRNRGGP